ncbi:hypothetical protein [Mucilaginibacter polytrichastri]|nr:hypothetical protein [Mucilaginibacter polytrichastri]SFS73347.1 hypothetical protein SAMN04487890_103216 [Mucilaginibacter polytrichastri]
MYNYHIKPFILLAFTVFILLSSFNSNKSIQDDKVSVFWKWFSNHKTEFEYLDDKNRDQKLDLILEHLHPISEGLAVEVSDEYKGVRDILISANGDKNNFSAVKNIVNSAPLIKGWTVTAFRQRANKNFTLKYQDIYFRPSQMFFYPIIKNDSLDLIIYVKGLKSHDSDKVNYYGLIAMDNVLGEYDSVTKVRYYDFEDLGNNKDRNLKPVTNLPKFIDSLYKIKH